MSQCGIIAETEDMPAKADLFLSQKFEWQQNFTNSSGLLNEPCLVIIFNLTLVNDCTGAMIDCCRF